MKYKQISSIHTAESIPALERDYIDNVRELLLQLSMNLREPVFQIKSKDYINPGKGC
jgi:hypothetical protein